MKSRKGIELQSMVQYGLMLVLIGVVLSVGIYINSQIQTAAGWASTTLQYQAVQNATLGLANLSSWLPIVAVIIAAAIIISLLVRAFAFGGGQAGV